MSLTVAELQARVVIARAAYLAARANYYGGVASVTLSDGGTGYPTDDGKVFVTFTGGGESAAGFGYAVVASGSPDGVITDVVILEPGAFETEPTVAFLADSGSGAAGTAVLGTSDAAAAAAYAAASGDYAVALAQLAEKVDPVAGPSAVTTSAVARAQQDYQDALDELNAVPSGMPNGTQIANALSKATLLQQAVDAAQKLATGQPGVMGGDNPSAEGH